MVHNLRFINIFLKIVYLLILYFWKIFFLGKSIFRQHTYKDPCFFDKFCSFLLFHFPHIVILNIGERRDIWDGFAVFWGEISISRLKFKSGALFRFENAGLDFYWILTRFYCQASQAKPFQTPSFPLQMGSLSNFCFSFILSLEIRFYCVIILGDFARWVFISSWKFISINFLLLPFAYFSW